MFITYTCKEKTKKPLIIAKRNVPSLIRWEGIKVPYETVKKNTWLMSQ